MILSQRIYFSVKQRFLLPVSNNFKWIVDFWSIFFIHKIAYFSWNLDFDLSTLNETEGEGYTYNYASSNIFAKIDRCAMDDLETLVFSMWHVAGFDFAEPFGSLLMQHKINNTATSWVKVSETICEKKKIKIQ